MTPPRFVHLGLAVPDLARSRAFFETALDHVVVRGPYDDPVQDARVLFLAPRDRPGEPIELVAPASAGSHVHRLVGRGAGAYHACYEVDDLAQQLVVLRSAGALVVREPAPALAFGGREIAWVYTPDKALLELLAASR